MEKLNLYQKLVEIRKRVDYLQKSGKGHNFSYATESQILGAIRPAMDELSVFLEMDMTSLEAIQCTVARSGGPVTVEGVKAAFRFVWVNAENPGDRIEKTLIVQDDGSDISTVGGLMTYAHRYFLYKFFSVPTDKDDPDAFENTKRKKDKREEARPSAYITAAQQDEIRKYATAERIERICKNYRVSDLSEIKSSDFDFIMNAIRPKERAV